MNIFERVFNHAKCYSCNKKFSLTSKVRKCEQCGKIYSGHRFCRNCSLKVKTEGTKKYKRYCLQCHSHMSPTNITEVKLEQSPQPEEKRTQSVEPLDRKANRRMTKLADQEAMSRSVLDIETPKNFRRVPRQTTEVKYIARNAGFSSKDLENKDKVKEAVTVAIAGLKPLPSKGKIDESLRKTIVVLDNDPQIYYAIIRQISSAATATVYAARSFSTGKNTILKKIRPENLAQLTQIQDEIVLNQHSSHKNMLEYYDSFYHDNQIWIAHEMLDFTIAELANDRAGFIPEKHMAYIIRELLIGLSFLHKEGRIHRDVKSSNIMISRNGDVKLGDFGFAAQLVQELTRKGNISGNPSWMAPELITGANYDEKVDIWAFGILLIELAEGRPPYATENPMKILYNIVSNPPPTLQNKLRWSLEFRAFVSLCLTKEPSQRPSADQLITHSFIEQYLEQTAKEQFADYIADFRL